MQAAPDQLERGVDGLMRAKPGVALDAASGNVLMSGALEGSNVSLPETMVNMISLARQFELPPKLMKTTEDNPAASSTLTRTGCYRACALLFRPHRSTPLPSAPPPT